MISSKYKKKYRGFGIIEVLITAVLLIIITGSVIGLSRTIVRNNIVSVQRTQAYNLLREQLEKVISIRNTNWQKGYKWDNEFVDFLDKINIDNTIYKIDRKIIPSPATVFEKYLDSDYAGSLDDQIKKIEITITWRDASREYSVSDEIILSNWKPQL